VHSIKEPVMRQHSHQAARGRQSHRKGARSAFTLVELLVVIALIGILVAPTLPAVQASRESARRVQCASNLKQLALAMHGHESTYSRFPSNGWGYLWVGDPDRGTDRHQPGGWIYNILPYLEQNSLRDMGRGEPVPGQWQTLATLIQQPLPLLNCPSRPGDAVAPHNPALFLHNADPVMNAAKTDYAVNEGDFITDTRGGPATLNEGDSGGYPWQDTSKATGICFLRSEIRTRDVQDGMSNTYLLGEKYVSWPGYNSDQDAGHDQSMYCGVDLDINRWVIQPPLHDGDAMEVRRFGSAHPSTCHMALCDGSVRSISYAIDGEVHRRLGNRQDGQPVELP
jgi:prepilin-type N-terminal cleavage/methylation domain-containing protein